MIAVAKKTANASKATNEAGVTVRKPSRPAKSSKSEAEIVIQELKPNAETVAGPGVEKQSRLDITCLSKIVNPVAKKISTKRNLTVIWNVYAEFVAKITP